MKAILMSVHAKWCAKIMNGDKTIEVRKGTALYKAIQKLIDEYGFAEFYVYCTKGKRPLWKDLMCLCGDEKYKYNDKYNLSDIDSAYNEELLNGKVIFKFRCYKVEEIRPCDTELLKQSCLTKSELINYLCVPKAILLRTGCAIHISDLEIFDKPKELSEFKKYNDIDLHNHICLNCSHSHHYFDESGTPIIESCCDLQRCNRNHLTKAPQSWQWIEVGE